MNEIAENFRINIEKERIRLGYSQAEWAKKLGLSLSSYKRLLNRTQSLDFDTICRLHFETGMMIFEFFEVSSPRLDVIRKLRGLSDEQIKLLSEVIDSIERRKENVVEEN